MKDTMIIRSDMPVFRANLHCHSTISDGSLTVEQIRDAYMAQGYQIVAFTDHDVFLRHGDLAVPGKFLPLNGYEMEVTEEKGDGLGTPRTAHMCFIAKTPDIEKQVCYHREKYVWGNALQYRDQLHYEGEDFEREHTHGCISTMFRLGHEGGFFVTYNHPDWSLENYADYSGYEGMDAMEIFNTGCERAGFHEYNSKVYEDLLRQGKRLYCIAADDNHNMHPMDHPLSDSFGGWVMIQSPELKYETVMKAVEQGHFYASCGPEIKELRVENGYAVVRTSPAHRIHMLTGSRHTEAVGAHYGDSVTEAVFKIGSEDGYFRIDVIDDRGWHADTNAIWLDELKD